MTEHSDGEKAAFEHVWVHQTGEIPARGLSVKRTATPDELVALAAGLDIRSVTSLEASYELLPRTGGRYRLGGHIEARVVQACVVSLAPVETTLSEPLRAEFRDSNDHKMDDWDSEDAAAAAINREFEPIRRGVIDVGRVVFEQIAAVLDPYPRAPGATFDWTDPRQKSSMEGASGEDGGVRPDNPFAVLRKLRGDG